ncbi:MAG: hypothetical protein CVT79_00440 [Alphaproteobacteria bacterium HGW-Alphaproteobacteria-18]|nr:MAG: hypothetical protein CVT79_00440 [Alphaproteobacteria bacterium HGW-Alphaproteobacteria-18]
MHADMQVCPGYRCFGALNLIEEVVKFTLLTRDMADARVERCSEGREGAELSVRVNQKSI